MTRQWKLDKGNDDFNQIPPTIKTRVAQTMLQSKQAQCIAQCS